MVVLVGDYSDEWSLFVFSNTICTMSAAIAGSSFFSTS